VLSFRKFKQLRNFFFRHLAKFVGTVVREEGDRLLQPEVAARLDQKSQLNEQRRFKRLRDFSINVLPSLGERWGETKEILRQDQQAASMMEPVANKSKHC
jgi:hypothetical protein